MKKFLDDNLEMLMVFGLLLFVIFVLNDALNHAYDHLI